MGAASICGLCSFLWYWFGDPAFGPPAIDCKLLCRRSLRSHRLLVLHIGAPIFRHFRPGLASAPYATRRPSCHAGPTYLAFLSFCIPSYSACSSWRRSPPRRVLLQYLSFFFFSLTLDSLLLSLLAPARCCHAGLVGVVLSFFSSLALHPFSFVSLGWWLDTTQSRIVILTIRRSSESSLAASLVHRCGTSIHSNQLSAVHADQQ